MQNIEGWGIAPPSIGRCKKRFTIQLALRNPDAAYTSVYLAREDKLL